jgi:hypothetical protein
VSRSARLRAPLATLALFVLLAVVHTWPIASAPARLGRNSSGDTQLNAWTMAWVAHQVVRDPMHLFDANIFYPEKRTLAFSEHLFVQSMMVAPVQWAGGSPILAFNLALIAGFTLTGWTMALVIHRWTGSWPAGVMSGSLAAFNAMTLTRLPHIQMQHLEFFPLVLLALDRLLVTPNVKHALQLAVWYALQALTSAYFLTFAALSLIASALVRPGEWAGKRARIVLPLAALAAVVALAALLPFVLPYVQARNEQHVFVRTLRDVASYSARWTDYLATGGTIHHSTWSGRFFRGDGLFPGVTALVLTVVAIGSGVAFVDRRARMALGFGVVCLCLSFGPAFPLYAYLYEVFPPMAGLRAAVRFGQMVLIAVAILAGFGLTAVLRRVRPRLVLPIALIFLLGAHAEAIRAPFRFEALDEFRGIPRIFKAVASPDPDVVVIFPFYPPERLFMNARYMLVSTAFWKPMLNGYSGYMPTRYIEHTQNLGGFPDERSIEYLKRLGVTRVLVDSRNMPEASLVELPKVRELSLIGTDGNLRIYALKP